MSEAYLVCEVDNATAQIVYCAIYSANSSNLTTMNNKFSYLDVISLEGPNYHEAMKKLEHWFLNVNHQYVWLRKFYKLGDKV